MKFIVIYITHKNLKEAKRVANHLIKQRLVACANYFPIESAYWWKGKIVNAKEVVSIVKTRTENWNKAKKEVEKIHPYSVPCIMKIEVEANKKYVDWIHEETK